VALQARYTRAEGGLDLPRMAEIGITPGRVIQALQNENATVPGGSIDIGSQIELL
jgi:multidrug efflux pump subunit AcrB